jgi:hypothetical protein
MLKYRHVSFYARVIFLKNAVQIKIVKVLYEIPISNNLFPIGWGTENLILYSV